MGLKMRNQAYNKIRQMVRLRIRVKAPKRRKRNPRKETKTGAKPKARIRAVPTMIGVARAAKRTGRVPGRTAKEMGKGPPKLERVLKMTDGASRTTVPTESGGRSIPLATSKQTSGQAGTTVGQKRERKRTTRIQEEIGGRISQKRSTRLPVRVQ